MTVIGKGRYAFKAIDLDTSEGQGVQVTIGGSGNPVGQSSLVTSFAASQQENVGISQCLNGGVYLYAFGHSPEGSAFSLGITTFLNTCTGDMSRDLSAAVAAYRNGRVSQSKQLSSLTIGNTVLRGYLVGQDIRVVDTEIGVINTTYNFIALNPQGG